MKRNNGGFGKEDRTSQFKLLAVRTGKERTGVNTVRSGTHLKRERWL